jgi:hypothetical protein
MGTPWGLGRISSARRRGRLAPACPDRVLVELLLITGGREDAANPSYPLSNPLPGSVAEKGVDRLGYE